MPEKEETFEIDYLVNLFDDKMNVRSKVETSDEKLELALLENESEHRFLESQIKKLNKEYLSIYDCLGTFYRHLSDARLTQDQKNNLQECVGKTIPGLVASDPKKGMDQIIAIAFSKCRKKLGLPDVIKE